MAHKKSAGTTRNGRDSNPKYLGIKVAPGALIQVGSILVRQRGTKFHPGLNVKKGVDDTLFAKIAGKVKFRKLKKRKFDNSIKETDYIDILPE